MGRNFATDLAASDLPLEAQIEHHLTANHFPPVPLSMVRPCLDAIEACLDYNPEQLIELPAGVSWRGQDTAPAAAIVQGHHLEAWLECLEPDYED